MYVQDGDCYTEAHCEAIVMCGNNHWIMEESICIDLVRFGVIIQ